MPTTWVNRGDAKCTELSPHYQFPDIGSDGEEVARGSILDVRKRAIQRRDEMLAFQKAAAKERDFEMARFFSDEAAHHLKHYKACLFVIPWLISEFPKDCREERHEDWPMELHQAMDDVLLGIYQ